MRLGAMHRAQGSTECAHVVTAVYQFFYQSLSNQACCARHQPSLIFHAYLMWRRALRRH